MNRDTHLPTKDMPSITPGTAAGLFCLSVATLMYEINLTRLFSVAQFYHFAFMIISMAMLGFGASGTVMALSPRLMRRLGRHRPHVTLARLALGYGLACIGAYLLTNLLPFDSFSIAWDRRQIAILALHYLALSLPFFCSGAALGLLFIIYPKHLGRLYAVNLAGSAVGCVLALLVPAWIGGEGVVWLAGILGGGAAVRWMTTKRPEKPNIDLRTQLSTALLIAGCAVILLTRPDVLELHLSPYKGLSYALQFPGARIVSQRWNSFSRVDVIESAGVRSLPGLSYRYVGPLPPQRGLLVDGDDLNPALTLPVTTLNVAEPGELAFTGFLPTAIAYQLRPDAHVLMLEPKGGLEIWTALAQGAAHVTAVEANPLIADATGDIYNAPRVTTVIEDARSFVRRTTTHYAVVTLALTTPYRPIRSGAYSLAEDYHHTVEAFRDYLTRLTSDGLLVITRWVQMPPSESLRAFALAVTAIEAEGGDPAEQIVAFRGYMTLTLLAKKTPFTSEELATIRQFAADRAFDLVYAPDIQPTEVNRYNILPEPSYYQAFTGLLAAENRTAWYAAYPFDVTPPTDAHPFFGHFFRWSQARQVLAELGKSWQPFGGAGYFVLVALLALAVGAALLLIVLPVIAARGVRGTRNIGMLVYFGLLGLGFLLVEIPLMQRFILFLGHPAYAMTTVLFAILLFSGVGSALSHRISLRRALILLVGLVLIYRVGLSTLFSWTMELPLIGRMGIAVLTLAPAGVLMGIPFPQGLRRLEANAPQHIPWAWSVNGALSVIASVLAALLALSVSFDFVLIVGALCYVGVWITTIQGFAPSMPSPMNGTKDTPPKL